MQKLLRYSTLLFTGVFYFGSGVAKAQCNTDSVEGGVNCAGQNTLGGNLTGADGIVTNVVYTLIYATGIIAVIFIIIGGMRYIFSQGNDTAIQGAKNTILYAVIGLIIAILAFAIVTFVFGSV